MDADEVVHLIRVYIACFIIVEAAKFIENVERNTSTLRDADCGRGVVVAVARKCGSTTTSNVYCRDVDDSGKIQLFDPNSTIQSRIQLFNPAFNHSIPHSTIQLADWGAWHERRPSWSLKPKLS